MPSALEAWSLNRWTTKEVLILCFKNSKLILIKTAYGIEYIFCRTWERRLDKADVLERPGVLEAVLPPEYFRMMWTLGFRQGKERLKTYFSLLSISIAGYFSRMP